MKIKANVRWTGYSYGTNRHGNTNLGVDLTGKPLVTLGNYISRRIFKSVNDLPAGELYEKNGIIMLNQYPTKWSGEVKERIKNFLSFHVGEVLEIDWKGEGCVVEVTVLSITD